MESYPKGEMDLKLKSIEDKVDTAKREITTELRGHNRIHKEILEQTTKTNGRVNKLEKWQNTLMGGVAVLIFLFPFFMYYFSGILEELRESVENNTTAIHELK